MYYSFPEARLTLFAKIVENHLSYAMNLLQFNTLAWTGSTIFVFGKIEMIYSHSNGVCELRTIKIGIHHQVYKK